MREVHSAEVEAFWRRERYEVKAGTRNPAPLTCQRSCRRLVPYHSVTS